MSLRSFIRGLFFFCGFNSFLSSNFLVVVTVQFTMEQKKNSRNAPFRLQFTIMNSNI